MGWFSGLGGLIAKGKNFLGSALNVGGKVIGGINKANQVFQAASNLPVIGDAVKNLQSSPQYQQFNKGLATATSINQQAQGLGQKHLGSSYRVV